MLHQPTGSPLLAELLPAVERGLALDALLTILTSRGLSSTPSFACVVHEPGGTRVVLRGPFTAAVTLDGVAGAALDGDGVSTWLEHRAPEGATVSLSTTAGSLLVLPGDTSFQPDLSAASLVVHPTPPAPPPEPSAAPRHAAPTAAQHAAVPAPDPGTASASVAHEADGLPEPAPAGDPSLAAVPDLETPDDDPDDDPDDTGVDAESTSAVAPHDETATDWHTHRPTAAEPDPFRHMLEHTLHFGVEAAAVRALEDEDRPAAAPPPAPATPSAATTTTPAPTPPPTAVPVPPLPAVGAGGLIDAVPGSFFAPGPAPEPPPPARPVTAVPEDSSLTLTRAEILRLAGGAAAPHPTASAVEAALDGPRIQAVHCSEGHPNPPTAERCRICAKDLSARDVTWVARPILARLRFQDGLVHAVHRPVLLGRQPNAESWTGGEEPQLLTLPDPEMMLSRTHAELRLSEWRVHVVDRDSRNKTEVTLPGRDPQQLRPREPFLLVAGAQVSLGGVTSFVYEESAL